MNSRALLRAGVLACGLLALHMAAEAATDDPAGAGRSALEPVPDTRTGASPDAAAAGFDSLDTDRDGGVDRGEARFLPRLSREFDHWDRDDDGALDAAEFRDYMERST